MKPTVTNYRKLLKTEPTNREAIDFLEKNFVEQHKWPSLVDLYQSLANELPPEDDFNELWQRLVAVLEHISHNEQDEATRRDAMIRLGDLYAGRFRRRDLAAESYVRSFKFSPNVPALNRLIPLYEQIGEWAFVVQLLEEKRNLLDDPQLQAELLYRIGDMKLNRLSDHEGAEATFRALLELIPDDPRAVAALSDIEHENQGWSPVIDEYIQQAESAARPADAAALFLKVATLIYQDFPQSSKVAQYLWKSFDYDAFRVETRVFIESFFVDRQDWEGLRTYYGKRLEVAKNDEERGECYQSLAFCMENMGLPLEQIVPIYEEAYQRLPHDQGLLNNLVEFYSGQQDWEHLVSVYQIALKGTADEGEQLPLYLQIGMLLWRKLENVGAAERIFRRVRSIAPQHPLVANFYEEFYRQNQDWMHLSTILEQKFQKAKGEQQIAMALELADIAQHHLNNDDKAIMSLTRAMGLDPANLQIRDRLAELYERTGRWHALLEILHRKIDDLSPESVDDKVDLYFKMIEIYQDPEKLPIEEMVINTYNKIVELSPDNIQALDSLARKYEDKARWRELVYVLQKRVEASEDAEMLLDLFSRIAQLWMERIRNPAQAIPALQEVFRLDPSNLEVVRQLRRIYKSKHDLEKLYETYQAELALVEAEGREDILLELAVLATEQLGRLDDAADYWQQLFDINPQNQQAFDALVQLKRSQGSWEPLIGVYARRIESSHSKKRKVALYETLAATLFDVGEADRAEEVLKSTLELDPSNASARDRLHRLYIKRQSWEEIEALYARGNDWQGYIDLLEDVQSKEADLPKRIEFNRKILVLYEDKLKDAAGATRILERIWKLEPDNLDQLRQLIAHYKDTSQWTELMSAQEALLHHTEEAEERRLLMLDNVHLAEEKLGDAKLAFDWCSRVFPEDMKSGDLRIIDDLERLTGDADCWHELMIVYKNQIPEIDEPEQQVNLMYRVAELAANQVGDLEEAVHYYQAVIDLEPQHVESLQALEGLYGATQNIEGLEKVLSRKLQLELPVDERKLSLEQLGNIYENLMLETEKAIEAYQGMLDIDPADGLAIDGLKRMYARDENWEELIGIMDHELRYVEADEVLDLKYEMGRVYEERIGDLERAVTTYKDILNLNPQHANTYDALEALLGNQDVEKQVAEFLERFYREQELPDKLANVLTIELKYCDDRLQRLQLLRELEGLYRNQLEQIDRTFDVVRQRFLLEPDSEPLWENLSELGRVVDGLPDVVAVFSWASGLVDDPDNEHEPLHDDHLRKQLMILVARLQMDDLFDPPTALTTFERAHELDSQDVVVLNQMEVLYRTLDRFEELLSTLKKRLELTWEPEDKVGLLLTICNLLEDELERFEDTEPFYQQVLNLDPSSVVAYEAMERLQRESGRFTELVELLQRRLGYTSDAEVQIQLHYAIAVTQRDELDNLEDAIREFATILGMSAEHNDSLMALEALLADRELPQYEFLADEIIKIVIPLYQAREDWHSLVRLNQEVLLHLAQLRDSEYDQYVVLRRVGELYETRLENDELAFENYCAALKMPSSDTDCMDKVIELGNRLEEYETLVGVLQEVVEPHETKVLCEIAEVYYARLEQFEPAIEWYNKALDSDPICAPAISALEAIQQQQGDDDALIEVWQKKVQILDEPAERRVVMFQIAEKQRDLERTEEAIDSFQSVLDVADPAENQLYVPALTELLNLYEEVSDWTRLVEVHLELAEVEAEDEDKAIHLLAAADIEEQQLKDVERAISLFGRVRAIENDNKSAMAALERLYRETGKWEELIELLREGQASIEEPAVRLEMSHEMARVAQVHLLDVERAVGMFESILDQDVGHEATLQSLNELVEDSNYQHLVLPVLHRAYEIQENYARLIGIKQKMADGTDDPGERLPILLDIAKVYEENLNDDEKAFDACRAILVQEPTSIEYQDKTAALASKLERFEDYIETLKACLEQVLDIDHKVRLLKAVAYTYKDDLENNTEAARVFEEIRSETPYDLLVISELEGLYETEEQHEPLLEILQARTEYLEDLDEKLQTLHKTAVLLRDVLDRPEDAVDPLRDAISMAPERVDQYDELSSLYEGLERWEDLVALLSQKGEHLQQDEDRFANIFREVDVLINRLDRAEEALPQIKIVLESQPEDPEAIACLEQIQQRDVAVLEIAGILEPYYRKQEDWEKLCATYQRYADELSSPAERVDYLEKKAVVEQQQLEKPEEAFETRLVQVVLAGLNSDLQHELWMLAQQLNRWPDVVNSYLTILEQGTEPEYGLHLNRMLGHLYRVQLNDREKAIDHYRVVMDQGEYDEAVGAELLALYVEMQRWNDLVALYERLVDATHEPEAKRNHLMQIAAIWGGKLSELDEAADAFRRVLELVPGDFEAFKGLEFIYTQSERWQDLIDLVDHRLNHVEDRLARMQLMHQKAVLLADKTDYFAESVELYREILSDEGASKDVLHSLEEFLEKLHLLGADQAENILRAAEILEGQYDPQRAFRKLIKNYQIQLEYRDDVEIKIQLHMKIVELYRTYARDANSAFNHQKQAVLLDFSNTELLDELETIAEQYRLWEGLVDTLKQGAEAGDSPLVREQTWFKIARIYEEKMRRYDLAETFYQKVLEENPSHLETLDSLEKFARREYKFEDLVTILESKVEYLESVDDKVGILHELAELYQKKFNDSDKSVETYRRVIELAPEDDKAVKQLEKIFKTSNDSESLVELYYQQVSGTPNIDHKFKLLMQIALLLEEGLEDPHRALDALHAADEINPGDSRVLDSMDRLHVGNDDWEKVLEVLERKQEGANEFQLEELRFRMGEINLTHVNHPERALEYFKLILERNPSHQRTVREIEKLLDNQGMRFMAALTLEEIYEAKRQSRNLATVLTIQLEYVAEKEERIVLLNRLSVLYEQALRKPADAYRCLSEAFLLEPDNKELRAHLEQQTQRLSYWDQLAEVFEKALTQIVDPDDAREMSVLLADIYENKLRDDEKATTHYLTILSFDEFNASALAALSKLYEKQENWVELSSVLQKQIELFEGQESLDLKYKLAQLYQDQLQRDEDALEIYKQILWERSDHTNALNRLEQLAQNIDFLSPAAQFLEPFYQQNKNWTKLVWLLSLLINRMGEKNERANAFIKLAEINEKYLSNKREAFNAYLDALDEDPSRVQVLDQLEGLAKRLNIWEELVESVDALHGKLEGAPQYQIYLSRLGSWYMDKLHDLTSAEEKFSQVLQLNDDSQEAITALEDIYKRNNKIDSLIDIYERKARRALEVKERKQIFYQIAQLAHELGDTEKATAYYQDILGIDSSERRALDALDKIFVANSDYDSLATILERKAEAFTRKEEVITVKLRLADVRREHLQSVLGAIDTLEEIIGLDSTHRQSIGMLRDLYRETENWSKLKWITQCELDVTVADHHKVGLLFQLAELTEERLDDAHGAIPHLAQILTINPEEQDALDEMIRLYHKTEQWEKLIETYSEKIDGSESLDARYPLWITIADIYSSKLGNDDDAISTLAKILDRQPNHIEALSIMANINEKNADWSRTAEVLEQIVQIAPEHEQAGERYEKLGGLYRERLNDAERAEYYYSRVLTYSPDHSGAHEALVSIYRERGDWGKLLERMEVRVRNEEDEAVKLDQLKQMADLAREQLQDIGRFVEYAERSLEIREDQVDLVKELTRTYLEQQDFERAAVKLEWMVQYLRNNRKFKQLHTCSHQLGGVYEKIGDKDQAIKFYKLANEQLANINSPSYLANLIALGRLLCERELWDDALKIYQTMLLQQTRIKDKTIKVELFFNLGRIMLQRDDTRRAKEYLNRVLSVDKSHEAARAILDGLSRG